MFDNRILIPGLPGAEPSLKVSVSIVMSVGGSHPMHGLPTELFCPKLWVSAFQAALSRLQRCLPKWVRFNGSLLNIKNKMASLTRFSPRAGTVYDVDRR